MRFGEMIKKARKDRFSQQTLGEQIGVWGTYIGQIEKSERLPSDERCLQLAEVLELDPYKLLLTAYRERAQSKQVEKLFAQLEKLLTDPFIRLILSDPKLLDSGLINAIQNPGIRCALKNADWRQALEVGSNMHDRDIPGFILLIEKIAQQQWEALLSTAKAFANVS